MQGGLKRLTAYHYHILNHKAYKHAHGRKDVAREPLCQSNMATVVSFVFDVHQLVRFNVRHAVFIHEGSSAARGSIII